MASSEELLNDLAARTIIQEAEREEDQRLEIQARKELEDAGCPPCYPRDLDLTTQDVPEEFQPIVEYWSQGPPWERLILCTQNLDYKEFRRYQLHTRSRLRHKYFPDFEEEVLRRRQKYGLHGNVNLLPDFKQHSQLQNWTEFQDFHLRKLEQVETEQEEFRQKLSSEPKEGIDSNIPYLESGLNTVAWEIEQCKVLLK
nr:hypothetical protein CFP56_01019 [Quercus suber]